MGSNREVTYQQAFASLIVNLLLVTMLVIGAASCEQSFKEHMEHVRKQATKR